MLFCFISCSIFIYLSKGERFLVVAGDDVTWRVLRRGQHRLTTFFQTFFFSHRHTHTNELQSRFFLLSHRVLLLLVFSKCQTWLQQLLRPCSLSLFFEIHSHNHTEVWDDRESHTLTKRTMLLFVGLTRVAFSILGIYFNNGIPKSIYP